MFRVFALAVLALLAPLEGGGVMFAARQIFLGRCAKAAWRNPYVTDGLVAMWDGEWNAGGGVHDSAATTWKNLTGDAAWDLAVPSSWRNGNSLYMDGTWNAIGPKTSLSELTIEVVSSGYSEKSGGALCAGWSLGKNGKRPSFLITRSLFRNYITTSTFDATLPTDSDCKSTSVTFGQSSTTVYSGGRFKKSSLVFLSPGTTPNSFRLGGYGNASDGDMADTEYYYKGDIHRCAIYSRALTADEIAANYAIDKERFNLP